jgi:RNA polymerase subunit RPABC4/transcription elongation factor Spt4
MDLVPCRDCQTMLPPSATGCPMCARNITAERMVTKFVLIAVALVIILAGVFIGAAVLRR